MEMIAQTQQPSKKVSDELQPAFLQLQKILLDYLDSRPNLSLNGLAKRCAVSEPTLRRIRKGQLKTLPEVTTIIDLLCYVSQENNARKIPELFPGPLAEYLKSKAPVLDLMVKVEVSEELTQTLKDPVKYLIYKRAVNDSGVTLDQVLNLFGSYGEKQLAALIQEGLVTQEGDLYKGENKVFTLSNDVFVEHFKATADFIKPHKLANSSKNLSPGFANYSSGLNKKAYTEVLNIQRKAMNKIRKILFDPNAQGKIPTFVLAAVDTLDSESADEISG